MCGKASASCLPIVSFGLSEEGYTLIDHAFSALFTLNKKWVVLYVAHNNPAAAKVYDKVGFVGLCGKPRVEGVDDWIEIGCQNTELGHW